MHQGRLRRALKKCRKALELSPKDQHLLLKEAEITLCMGQIDDAQNMIEALLQLWPESATALYLKGAYLLMRGQAQAAILPLTQALELESGLYQARKLLADALIEIGRFSPASDLIDEDLKSYQGDPAKADHIAGVLCSKARLLQRQGEPHKARCEVLQALRRYPANPMLLAALRTLNPGTNRETRHYSIQVRGAAPIASFYPGNPSQFFGAYEVIANSKREALEYIKEIEQIALPGSLRITSCKTRKATHFRHRGVLLVLPSFSFECAPQDIFNRKDSKKIQVV